MAEEIEGNIDEKQVENSQISKDIDSQGANLDSDSGTNPDTDSGKILKREIEDEMKESFLDYAMSVIVSRALPDVKDGLKPVHRRILFSMRELGLLHNKPFKKSARIVGNCMGQYHPHGDIAIYDSLVRMAQDFSLRYPLVDGQGNWGSVDGDPPAAQRYTEARLKKIAEEMLEEIDRETVDFMPNYDESLEEPCVLPSRIPNLLINGSTGIAVGMATNIPPHNLNEVCDTIIKLIDNPDTGMMELLNIVKGPDFPTAGIICGRSGIVNAYTYGRGRIIVKAKTEIETIKNKEQIIVTEIPFQVNKSSLIEEIANLVKDGQVQDVSDIRDESSRKGMRIVILLKQGASSEVVLNQLLKHSRLRTTFGANMLALVNGEPKTLNLLELLKHFIAHRKEVVTRRTEYDLKQAKEKAHKLEGLRIALDNIDAIVAFIKKSESAKEVMEGLMQIYNMTEIQAKTVLEMRLQRLTNLEQEKIRKDLGETLELIKELEKLLSDERLIYQVVKQETEEVKEKYGDERRTFISDEEEEGIFVEDLIEEEKMVVTATHSGYIKRLPLATYKQQRRGGKGVKGASTKEEDFIEDVFVASTHSYLLCFTDRGNVHWLKVYQIPEGSRQARGKAIVNLINLEKDEKVSALIPIREFRTGRNLVIATKKGIVKKTNLAAFSRPRKGGIKAITLTQDDELVDVMQTSGTDYIMLATAGGRAVRFSEKRVRPIGRAGQGVRGIKVSGGDSVVGMIKGNPDSDILTITRNGFGKRTPIKEYRETGRGGKGVINIKTTPRNGAVVSVKEVTKDNDVMFISKNGIVIRTSVAGVSCIGRNTQGVRLMRLKQGDFVVAAARVVEEEVAEEEHIVKIDLDKKEENVEEDLNNNEDIEGSNNTKGNEVEKMKEGYPDEPDQEETIEEVEEELADDEVSPEEAAFEEGYIRDEDTTQNVEVEKGDENEPVNEELEETAAEEE